MEKTKLTIIPILIFLAILSVMPFIESIGMKRETTDINIFTQNVTDLCDLNDTVCTSLENNDLLSWDSSLQRWLNKEPINFRWRTDDIYLYNDSTTMYLNESKLNATIDLRSVTDSEIIFLNNSEQIYIRENYPTYLNLSNILFINGTNGTVGIGTTTPSKEFEINGDMRVDIIYPYTSSTTGVGFSNDAGTKVLKVQDAGIMFGGTSFTSTQNYDFFNGVGNSGNNIMQLRNYGSGSPIFMMMIGNNGTGNDHKYQQQIFTDGSFGIRYGFNVGAGGQATNDFLRILNTGNIGIGTTTPQNKLNVIGDGNFTGNLYSENGSFSNFLNVSDDFFVNGTSGNVGIGTSSPLKKLSITPSSIGSKISLYDVGNPDNIYGFGVSAAQLNYHVQSSASSHVFYGTGDNGDGNELMRIKGTGHVGIGASNLTASLNLPPSTTTKASINILNGTAPTTANYGDIWREIIPVDAGGNPATDNLMMNTTTGSYDLLAPQNSGDYVYVDSLDDLPAPVGGKIYLENKRYYFRGDSFILPYTLVIPENVSASILDGVIIYVGGGTLFESSNIGDGILYIRSMSIVDGVGNATLFNISGTNIPNSIVRADAGAIIGFNSLGTISDIDTFALFTTKVNGIGYGINLNDLNSIGIISNDISNWRNYTTTMINVTGTTGIVNMIGNTFRPFTNESIFNFDSTGTFESGIVSSNTLNLAGGGSIFANNSRDQSDEYWTYAGNTNLADSTANAYSHFQDGVNLTTITLDDTFYKVNATWTTKTNERITTNGNWSYIGLENIQLDIEVELKIDPTSGASTTWEGKIFKNGIEINDSSSDEIVITAGATGFLSMESIESASTGDYFEVYVQRTDGAGDFTTTSGQFFMLKV